MRNSEIADAFTELADRLALTDTKPFRYMAYRKAATTFLELGESVALLSEEGRLRDIDGIGPAIEEKVAALLTTGTFPALERARADVDDTLLALTRLPGIGAATARKIYAAVDGESIASLRERAAAGTLEVGDGITKKVVTALAEDHARRAAGGGDEAPGDHSGIPLDANGQRLPGPWIRRDQAQSLLATLAEIVAPHVTDPQPSGDYVRGCELLHDVTLVATAVGSAVGETIAACVDALTARGGETGSFDGSGDNGATSEGVAQLVSPTGIGATLAIAAPDTRAQVDHEMAGPAAWIEHEPAPHADSIPVELRDAVLAGRLAAADVPDDLVRASDLRGELHAHSDWSDGRAPIIEMARAARDRGDEYFLVTDHSAPYAMVGGLTPERIVAQADEIARVNELLAQEHDEQGAPAFRVLRGTELEILADGTLGLPDHVLAQLDWVVASIHTQQRQAPDVILERMRRVLENPLVDAIGHPTSRRLLKRERTALDIHALIAMAVEHDVVLEINANPDRLDLDSEQAALALAAGARLTINTDAHRPSTLALREHGVAIARRAGARRRDVVNCLDAASLLANRRRDR